MRVIWLKSDYIDPPDTGGKLRTYNLLRELCNRCAVTYASLTSTDPKNEAGSRSWATDILPIFRREERKAGLVFYLRLLKRLFSVKPYIVQKYLCPEIQAFQQEPGDREESVLICDFLEMAGNVVWSTPWPKILFQHNVESVIWRRYVENETDWLKRAYFWFEYKRLSRYERKTCNQFDRVLAVSERDRDTMRSMGVSVPIEVIETGVDVEFFSPDQHVTPTPNKLLFLGSLDWMPNIDGLRWFTSEIYPLIRQKCPGVTLDIVGRRPTPFISSLPAKDESIRVFGDVPDVRPHIAVSDIFVVPLRVGSGTRLKVFEAMAMRRPVVSTTIGAEGLPLTHGTDVVLADSPEEYATQVAALLDDPARKEAIADNGYRLVTEQYSWRTVSNRLFEVCQDALGESVSA